MSGSKKMICQNEHFLKIFLVDKFSLTPIVFVFYYQGFFGFISLPNFLQHTAVIFLLQTLKNVVTNFLSLILKYLTSWNKGRIGHQI